MSKVKQIKRSKKRKQYRKKDAIAIMQYENGPKQKRKKMKIIAYFFRVKN